jgi:hypothetical protein
VVRSDLSTGDRHVSTAANPYSTCAVAGALVVQSSVAPERVTLLIAMSESSGGTGVVVGVAVGVMVAVAVIVAVGVRVGVGEIVLVGVGVLVGVPVGVGVEIGIRMSGSARDVGVAVCAVGPGEEVAVCVAVAVGVAEGEGVAEAVALGEAVAAAVGVSVGVVAWAAVTRSGSVARLATARPKNAHTSSTRPITRASECHQGYEAV